MVGPAHHVDARTFGGEREHGQRIGVLAADEAAHRAELGLERPEGVAIAAGVHQPLTHGGHDLLVLANQRAVGAEIDLGVEHGAERVRHLLAHAHHHIGVGVACGLAERRGLGARDFDGVLEQLGREPVGEGAGSRRRERAGAV